MLTADLYARYLCSRDALGLKAGATIGYLVYKQLMILVKCTGVALEP